MATYIVPGESGSILTGIILNVEELMEVNSGGTAYQCILRGGRISGFSSGMIQESVVSEGGHLVLSSGATGHMNTVSGGGFETVSKGGQETGATVSNGGLLTVLTSGQVYDATVKAGGSIYANLASAQIFNTILDGGTATVQNGASGCYTIARNGGLAEVSSGGYGLEAKIRNGGSMAVFSGGIANSCAVSAGGSMWIESGASVYNTTVSGGVLELANGADVRDVTTISSGGSLIATGTAELPVSDGWELVLSSGGKAEVSNLSIKTGGRVTMNLKSTLTFQSITTADADGFQLNGLGGYVPATGNCRKLMDCTADTPWSAGDYRDLLQCTEAVFGSKFIYYEGDLYLQGVAKVTAAGAAGETFATAQDAVALNPLGVTVLDGTFTATGNIPTFSGLATTISGGTFDTSICGGNHYDADQGAVSVGTSVAPKNISLTISGGVFNKMVVAGDRVDAATSLTRTGNVNLTLEGGTYNYAVAGAGLFMSTVNSADAEIVGDVTLTIKGGTFQDPNNDNRDWIYGGFIAKNRNVAANTTITGTVTVKLDSTDRALTVSHVVAGSYGKGKIVGGTKLELTGTYTVTAAELWGGCSGDYYTIGGSAQTYVKQSDDPDAEDGDRLLSFTGFRGTLNCSKIRDFTSAEFVCDAANNASTVTLTGCDMTYVSNWTFAYGCKLSGNNIANDFTGDAFAYGTTSDVVTSSWAGANVLVDVGTATLTGFDDLDSVKLFGHAAAWNGTAYVTDIEGASFNFRLYSTGTGLAVGIA